MKLEYKLQWQTMVKCQQMYKCKLPCQMTLRSFAHPWYANMRWKEFYTNPEVGYKQLYADDANTGVDPEYVFYQRRNRMYELQLKNAMELNRKRKRLGGH
ncbi:hypothetical protein TVAG_357610 [Trichomonas vaginalis G3]|uniref:Uncharacterized protein n=1 Tax=Trichomonas vaginalis (strain ATCC PRA-98 / G3) TaxID=412133 RepID=A2G1E3_TRIV3|nr:hypothetical protein TVAG_357610 [Trichomonas vaginalis G3]|eukprot:XP_001301953.1 hypothetical protein [Trichomonas vaginalis G3]